MRVAIIGGGISGLYLAWKLSEMGHKADVYERKEEIGNRACSGLFSEKILEYIPQCKDLILNRINSAVLNFPKKQVKLRFPKDFLVMSHYELDRLVAKSAQEAGAKITLSADIKTIPQGYDRVIGCDGPLSSIRKNLNLKDPDFKLGILGFSQNQSSGSFEAWPLKHEGFIWKIPRGENTEWGLMASPKSAKRIFDGFLENNGIKLSGIQSKLIPNGLILPRRGDITLCGDATGLTKPWSGGGVIWQLGLADLLLRNFPDFGAYCRKAEKMFKIRLKSAKLAVSLVYFLGFNLPFLLPKENKIENDSISPSDYYRRK